jgi:protein involved in polysaccharide export with SLBB domain
VLSQAGGLTEDAGAELYVIRGGGGGGNGDGTGNEGAAKIAIPVEDLMASRDPALNVPIMPGDIVSVPIDRQVYVYVDGAVKTPGRIEQLASRPITLLQAIAKAGGTTDRADLKGVQILRQNGRAEQTILEVSLKRIRQGKEPDPPLKDGDIVVVPETFF